MERFTPSFQPRGFRPPMSNAERQRQFRQRHPDYYRLLQAKRRAPLNAAKAAYLEAKYAAAAAALTPPAPVMTIPIPTRLALPAPVEQLEILAIERLKAMLAARAPVERSRAA